MAHENQDSWNELKRIQESADWENDYERMAFMQKFESFIRDYEGPLPNVRDILRPKEIEWLITESIVAFLPIMNPERLVDFLINSGYKDEPDLDGDGKPILRRTTPIHRAAKKECSSSIMSGLFKIYDRFDVNYTNKSGLTHFHVACALGSEDIVEKFLDHGHDPNCLVTKTSNSPLHMALGNGQYAAAKLLLRRGANPSLANKDGFTPLHITGNVDNTPELLLAKNDRYDPVKIDARDKRGNTPLHLSMDCDFEKSSSMTEFLLRHGADPNAANEEGSTPLHVNCRSYYHDLECIKIFFETCDDLKRKVQVDAEDKLGRTPLQWAVANIWPDVVETLLARGADLSNFVFPDESYAFDRFKLATDIFHETKRKTRAAPQAMKVVEQLEKAGYELQQKDALVIMKFFAEQGLLGNSRDIDNVWYEFEGFAVEAKKNAMPSGRSLYDAIRLAPSEAAKALGYDDYKHTWSTIDDLPLVLQAICAKQLCEKATRRFFRRWALDPFLELTHGRLPLLCCDMIMDELNNEDLFNICLTATD